MRAARAFGVVAALLLAAIPMLTGCAASVAGPSLVLRLASPDKADEDTAAPIRHFAAEVARRSGGTIRVEPVWDVAPPGVRDWDQVTARAVADGSYELGLVPSRGFDVLGVDTLRALNAPFLVNSQAAAKAVLDSDLRDDLMAGLPQAGLVGIDLFPDGLRHPFGYDHPLLGPDDYDGALIRSSTSDTVSRMFATLGATTTDDDAADGLRGAESQYSIAPQGAGLATGNVTFFAKTNALVASTSVAERVRPDQWEVLEEAAAATRDWQFGRLPSDLQAAAAFCRREGTIVSASSDQVAALEEKAAPVTDWLSQDPSTRRMIDAIGRLVQGATDSTTVTSCPSRTPGEATSASLAALDGRYFAHVFRRDLTEAGVTDENLLRENTGRLWFVLDHGRWSYRTKANHYVANPIDHGAYDVEGRSFVFYWDEGEGDWTRMRYRIDPQGALRFTDILDGHQENQALSEGWFGVPWTRIGDLPD